MELELFELVERSKNEVLVLLILGGVILVKLIEYGIKYLPRLVRYWSTGKKELPTSEWQSFLMDKLLEIERNLNSLTSIVKDQEDLIDKTSQGTLENILFDDNRSSFVRLKAFRRLLAMGKNGRVWEKGYNLIKESKEIWRDVLDTELNVSILDDAYYHKRLGEINTRIFDGFM